MKHGFRIVTHEAPGIPPDRSKPRFNPEHPKDAIGHWVKWRHLTWRYRHPRSPFSLEVSLTTRLRLQPVEQSLGD
jgi:hypothetical protein